MRIENLELRILITNFSYEGMLNALHVVVPVAVHQVCDQSAGSLGQVGGGLLDALVEGNALQDDDLLTVGREFETLHVTIGLRQLLAVGAISLH